MLFIIFFLKGLAKVEFMFPTQFSSLNLWIADAYLFGREVSPPQSIIFTPLDPALPRQLYRNS